MPSYTPPSLDALWSGNRCGIKHIVSRTWGHGSVHNRLNTLRSSFGEIPIGQITPEQVIDYVDKRLHAITSETLRKELTLFSRV